MRRALTSVVALAIASGCAGATARGGAKTPEAAAGEPPACAALAPLMDLRADLFDAPATDSELAPLVALDHELAAIAVARARLRDQRALAPMDARLSDLASKIGAHRATLASHVEALRESYGAVEGALDEASTCKGIDLRVPSAPPFATREQKRRGLFAPDTAEVQAQLRKNKATLRAKECGPATRLVSAFRSLDVSSKESVASVGGHLGELSFDGAAAKTRDRLASALADHAKRLAALEEARRANPGPATALGNELARLRSDLDDIGAQCIDRVGPVADQASAAGAQAPRRITVLVRPTWSDPETGEPVTAGWFGSGVLVRWKGQGGRVETRVLTNAHVLGGASSAELLEADRVQLAGEQGDKKDAPKPWKATLVRVSADDDLAILRVDEGAAPPSTGLSFRLTPPKEQEPVTAAGFPGIGGHPSFQISTGAVSNASLKAASGPFGVYVQHTAAIDPGNSGGPLFDAEGKLVGINTIKIRGRESVGLAIPASRVQLALLRADDKPAFDVKHAEALCNAFVSMLASEAPRQEVIDRISIDPSAKARRATDAETSAYRARIHGELEGPRAAARADAYAHLRAKLEGEGGVRALSTCEGVGSSKPGTFTARFATRTAQHTVTLAPEDGVLRIADVR